MDKNLHDLLDRYREDVRIADLNNYLAPSATTTPPRVQLKGCVGSMEAWVIAAAYLASPRPTLIIANDKDEAAYLENDLNSLLEQTVFFLPDSFKRPLYFDELNKNHVLGRAEVIGSLTARSLKHPIIVAYPESVFEQIVVPQELVKSRIDLAVKAQLDTDLLALTLVECGFERTDFVYEPGQFAIRGGIIDIYSFGNDMPYRIDLFDTEIETIRLFDPNTQLSVTNIGRVTILPNINTHFDRTQKASLLQIIPPDTVVWLHDGQLLLDKLLNCFDKAIDYIENLPKETEAEQEDTYKLLRDRAFVLPNDVMYQLQKLALVFTAPTDDDTLEAFVLQTDTYAPNGEGTTLPFAKAKIETVFFKAQQQPAFNKNFELLFKDLKEKDAQNFDIYIFTDNTRQIERLYTIFEDFKAHVRWHPIAKTIHAGFIDYEHKILFYTDHQIFNRFHKYSVKQGYSKSQALNIRLLKDLRSGDFVTHIDHGVGRFSGLETLDINGKKQESIRLIYKNNDVLYVSINSLHKISKFVGKEGTAPPLHKLGSDTWTRIKTRAKKQVKDIAKDLIKLYAERKASKGYAFPQDGYLQNELEATFIYEDTPDQFKATEDVKRDMQKPNPMDRLICGDVGFGKTEVAIRAAFKAVADGKQVAILVPTTILALQHYKTFDERFGQFGINVDYLNRFKTAKQRKEVIQRTNEGKVEVLIGTQAILNKELKFKDLGLLIIDEEQKFGVTAKEKLRAMKVNVDTLMLTATPIPRTLQFSLMAARDLSVINTPPPNRQPIQTEVRGFNEQVIKEAIEYEVMRGGQVFFIHNRVQSLPDMAALIGKLCPAMDIAVAHGQLPPDKLEEVLLDFIERKYDVLVATNIIETGLDIANANTIIINNAHQFGLSDLHQLRGRVGRSNRQAFCYLFCPALVGLTDDARKRLRTLEEFSDLGSGFQIAMRDLDIRGAGNLLGAEQSGFILDIGYETYQKILKEAIRELKETDFKDIFSEELSNKTTFVNDVQIEMDVEMRIPDWYVTSGGERLALYTELDNLETETELQGFATRLEDRFGRMPEQVTDLFDGVRVRMLCKELGLERLILKQHKLRCYFITNPQSTYYDSDVFKQILAYPMRSGDRFISFKQVNHLYTMVHERMRSVKDVMALLERIKKG